MAAAPHSRTLSLRSVFLIFNRQPASVLQSSAILSLFRTAFGEIDHYHSTRFRNEALDSRATIIFRDIIAADRLRQVKHMYCRLQTGPGFDGDEIVRAALFDEEMCTVAELGTGFGHTRVPASASNTRRRPVPPSNPQPATGRVATDAAQAPEPDAMTRILGAIVDPDGSSSSNAARYSRPSRPRRTPASNPDPVDEPHEAGRSPPPRPSTLR